jgi:hypothetical protein
MKLWCVSLLLAVSSQVQAISITTDASLVDNIPALTNFATNGDMMDGLAVTATFSSGFSQTLSWADTSPGAGGVFGSFWSLTESGDTFNNPWQFVNQSDDPLTNLLLDARPGFLVFDRNWSPYPGTPDSADGQDLIETPLLSGVANYSVQVGIGGEPPVGDLWHVLNISLDQPFSGNWSFLQDTDNDIRITAPEPGNIALMGLGLVILGMVYWRKESSRRS